MLPDKMNDLAFRIISCDSSMPIHQKALSSCVGQDSCVQVQCVECVVFSGLLAPKLQDVAIILKSCWKMQRSPLKTLFHTKNFVTEYVMEITSWFWVQRKQTSFIDAINIYIYSICCSFSDEPFFNMFFLFKYWAILLLCFYYIWQREKLFPYWDSSIPNSCVHTFPFTFPKLKDPTWISKDFTEFYLVMFKKTNIPCSHV